MSGGLSSIKTSTVDFHYLRVEDALRVVESLINEARLERKMISCNLITGRGLIQTALMEMLKNEYELEPRIPFTNTGMIIVDIY
jgi:dsDNA-specific endonuclease/ATPase MutS2